MSNKTQNKNRHKSCLSICHAIFCNQ